MSGNILDGLDIITQILAEGEDYYDQGTAYLLRVTTGYWKSQRKIGHLTKITEEGEVTNEIISEDYQITDKPIYATRLFKNKTKKIKVLPDEVQDRIRERQSRYGRGNQPAYRFR